MLSNLVRFSQPTVLDIGFKNGLLDPKVDPDALISGSSPYECPKTFLPLIPKG